MKERKKERMKERKKDGSSRSTFTRNPQGMGVSHGELFLQREANRIRTRYLRIHFDTMLTYKTQVESTELRCKKVLSALKAMA